MTKTENKFRQWANKEYPDGFIIKIPDFKAGSFGVSGLPDYLVINKKKTIWYEVKSIKGKTLNLSTHFTQGQQIILPKMCKAGADVKIFLFLKKGFIIIDFKKFFKLKKQKVL